MSTAPVRRLRVALVVQRYGAGIDGGSETLCREIAERLASTFEVEVLTTTATDYLTWKNELPEGVEEVNGVPVRRFSVASRRWVRRFGRLSDHLYATEHSVEDEIDWMIRQGPRSLALLDHLKRERARFDAVVFFTYLYYTTWFGLPLVAEKSVLVPTVHDEPPARFEIFRALFRQPRAFVWNTPEERALATRLYEIPGRGEVAGIGVAVPEVDPAGAAAFRTEHGLGEYVLYLGRIDVWKGVPALLDDFARYRAERGGGVDLVLAGKAHLKLRSAPGVRLVGFLSEMDKQRALAAAAATIVPSAFESLSVVALESWAAGTPVVASAKSEAVAGQCARSGAGITYASYEEFRTALDRVRGAEGRELGASGRSFVRDECSWDRVLGVYRRAIEIAASPVA